MLPTPTHVVSIHGVGQHEPGQVEKDLRKTLGATSPFEIVDYNWSTVVDRQYLNDEPAIIRLAIAIAVANDYLGRVPDSIRLLVRLVELVWGLAFLLLAIAPLMLVPTVLRLLSENLHKANDVGTVESMLAQGTVALLQLLDLLLVAGLAGSLCLLAIQSYAAVRYRAGGRLLARVSLLVFLRPVLVLVFSLPLLKGIGFFAMQAVGVISLFSASYLLMSLIGLVSPVSLPSISNIWGVYSPFFAFVGAGLLVGGAFTLFGNWIKRPIRFFRDVFHYVGEVEFRSAIQDELTTRIAGLPVGADVAIVSHSLGSVIAVDSLTNGVAWQRFRSVTLVTGGSPISRWFQRFFPDLFFSQQISEVSRTMRCNTPLVGWINVYRVHDPVGAALALSSNEWGNDRQTEKEANLKGLAAHTQYWESEHVHRAVGDAWKELCPFPSTTEDLAPKPETSIEHSPVRRFFGSVVFWVIGVASILAATLSIAGFVEVRYDKWVLEKEFVRTALTEGVRAEATVTHILVDQPNMPDNVADENRHVYAREEFAFAFETDNGPRKVEFVENPGSTFCCRYFDAISLRKQMRSNTNLRDAETFTVEIAYLESIDDLLVVPLFEPSPLPWYGSLESVLISAAIFLFGLVMATLIAVMLTSLLYMLLLGVNLPTWEHDD